MEYNKRLYESLIALIAKYDSLNNELESASLPVSRITEINKQLSKITPIKEKFLVLKKTVADAINDEKLLETEKNPELIELAKIELEESKPLISKIEEEIKLLLLPEDPYDGKNVIIEMRPAAGGDESAIFTADLFETYKNYCDTQK
jgi:peptide chain release factor 1